MNILNKIHFYGDRIIWRIIIILFLISVLIVFASADSLAADDQYRHGAYWYLIRHLKFFAAGFITLYIFHRIPISIYKKFAASMLIVSIGLLLYTALFGMEINGAKRWISIFGISLQTADVAKISIVLYLAGVLEDNAFERFKDVIKKIILPIGTVFILTFAGGTSMGLLLGVICMSILFIGGLKLKHLLKIFGLAIAGLALLIVMGLTVKWPPRVSTMFTRTETYVGANNAGNTASKFTQEYRAKIAVASGGIVGQGPGNSTQRYLIKYSYSDFVFAMIIEEYGLVAGIIILFAYMALLYRAAVIAKKCTRIFSSVTVLGLMLMIVFQAMVNMGVSVGIFPVTGQTLPFISVGGTSIVCMGAAFGIILSVSRAANVQQVSEQKSNDEKYIPNDANEKTVEYNEQ
ncbi:MAG: FtsW/RodA/SpoVE family cell cycle protein [Prevotellaceae bacterium]|jgi:cell division protein FtsW|nr:FtsW/RodA/SpoVE family cell cycle protein [Prevotellaceae bacterium]